MRTAAWQGVAVVVGFASTIVTTMGVTAASAGDDAHGIVPPGWHVQHVQVVGRGTAPARGAVEHRSLTVRKPFAPPPAEDDDVFVESGTVYGHVAAFDPAPRIDSGVQFPYGLDGVGGYGSDIGFSAGSDTDLYDRGALDQSRSVRLGVR